jgi:hypothetical protein
VPLPFAQASESSVHKGFRDRSKQKVPALTFQKERNLEGLLEIVRDMEVAYEALLSLFVTF